MSITQEMAILANTKENLRLALGLDANVPFSDYVENLNTEWSPSELFSEGQQGFWYEPNDISTLFQNIAGTIPVLGNNDPVGKISDKSGNNNHAVQGISSRRMLYKQSPSRLFLDKVDDVFNVTMDLSWEGTMIIATDEGVASYEIKASSNLHLLGGRNFPGNFLIGVLFRNGSLAESEKQSTENYFVNRKSPDSYINTKSYKYFWNGFKELIRFPEINTSEATALTNAWSTCENLIEIPNLNTSKVVDFDYAWSQCSSLTEFPIIDTSQGTTFRNTWMYCSALNYFPFLDVSKGSNFTYAWYKLTKLTSFPLLDTSNATDFRSTWGLCTNLLEFPLLDTSKGVIFTSAWDQCSSLIEFPLLDVSKGINFSSTWAHCTGLKTLPLLNTANGINFSYICYYCEGLESFPLLNTSKGNMFNYAWYSCKNLITFPPLNMSNGTNFSYAWSKCRSLSTFPPNMFDNVKVGDFLDSFVDTNLDQNSIDGILESLVASGIISGLRRFNQSGGSEPSQVGKQAIDILRSRGWTITVTGGY